MVFGIGSSTTMTKGVHLDLVPLTPRDVPDPSTPEFAQFLDDHFAAGEKLASSLSEWKSHSVKNEGTTKIMSLQNHPIKKELGISEYWCGRCSTHTTESVRALTRRMSRRGSHRDKEVAQQSNGGMTEVERQARVMSAAPRGLYERFRRGLLEYHSENEREYIESMRETECLQVFQPHVAEVWRLTFKTPPPTSPRSFVVLLLSRELRSEPTGERCFMNISLPFDHPDCPPKQGKEASRVRGKYVSVERVTETSAGAEVEWRMATSSDAGGNIPRFVTNSSLPSSIAEDVPSFLAWIEKKFPEVEGGPISSQPAA